MSSWARVWTRAVIVPAGRRASAAWLGCAIVGGVTFGPTGLQARDVTGLALHQPGVMATLAFTWILVFAPTARLILRAEAGTFLRSLPAPRWLPGAIGAAAIIGLQLPWLALWIAGARLVGLAVFGVTTLAILVLASWTPRRKPAGWPVWRGTGRALRAIHIRALRRRAGDALVRGAGLSLLAGAAGGLFVRNNGLVGTDAATVGASVIAIALIPAHVGVSLVIAGAHRETTWLAHSLGIRPGTRMIALVFAFAIVHLGATVLAVAAAVVVIETSPASIAAATAVWLGGTTFAIAVGTTLGAARVVLGVEASPALAGRTVAGSVVIGAGAVLCLGVLGVAGAAAFVATCGLALAINRSGREVA